MKNKLPTVTIGIPALNEQTNIAALLKNLQQQKEKSFKLEKIIVVSDGSTDQTCEIVQELRKKDKRIQLVHFEKNAGKAVRLNDLHIMSSSDLLLTIDADVLFKSKNSIENLVAYFKDPEVLAVAANHQPISDEQSFWARTFYVNYLLWCKVRAQFKNGRTIYNSYGSATMSRRSFYSKLRYPQHFTCDEGFIFLAALQKNGFRYAADVIVFQHPVTSFGDFRKLRSRSTTEIGQLEDYFGNIDQYYYVPPKYKVRAVLSSLLEHPLLTATSVICNLYVSFFPYQNKLASHGSWERVGSTKRAYFFEAE